MTVLQYLSIITRKRQIVKLSVKWHIEISAAKIVFNIEPVVILNKNIDQIVAI